MGICTNWATTHKEVKHLVETEPKRNKNCLLWRASLVCTVCIVLAGLLLGRILSIQNYRVIREDQVQPGQTLDYEPYDVECLTSMLWFESLEYYSLLDIPENKTLDVHDLRVAFEQRMLDYQQAGYSDYRDAFDLSKQLVEDGCSGGCFKTGTRWSKLIYVNFSMMLVYTCNMCFVCGGERAPLVRIFAALCSLVVTIVQIGTLAFSLYLFFLKQSNLCALSLLATSIPSDDPKEADQKWTYEKDSMLIGVAIFTQVGGSFFCLYSAFAPLRKIPSEQQKATIQDGQHIVESQDQSQEQSSQSEMEASTPVKPKKVKQQTKQAKQQQYDIESSVLSSESISVPSAPARQRKVQDQPSSGRLTQIEMEAKSNSTAQRFEFAAESKNDKTEALEDSYDLE